jgi:hypothetical protein
MDVSHEIDGLHADGNKAQSRERSEQDSMKEADSSNSIHFEPTGSELLETVVRLSGLDEGNARRELESILVSSGHMNAQGVDPSVGDLTIEDLRASMLLYLEEMNRTLGGDLEDGAALSGEGNPN